MLKKIGNAILASEYAIRRKNLVESLNNKRSIIFCSSNEKYYCHDGKYFPFKQDPNFLYFTGFDLPTKAIALIDSKGSFFLFLPKYDAIKALWEGQVMAPGLECNEKFGCLDSFDLESFQKVINSLIKPNEVLVVPNSIGKFNKHVDETLLDLIKTSCKTGNDMENETALIECEKLRVVKSPAELKLIKQATKITAQSHLEVIKKLKRKMEKKTIIIIERDIKNMIEYEFTKRGGVSPAFPSIVANGPNACTLHYTKNNSIVNPKLFTLIDAGSLCESHYCGDVTRTSMFDSNNNENKTSTVFSNVYEAVDDVRSYMIQQVVQSNLTFAQLNQIAMKRMRENFKNLFSFSFEDKMMPHSIGHFLGLDVHDTPSLGKNFKLPKNCVITIEPGLYFNGEAVPKEFRGIGVRIEDNVIVNENDCEDLTNKYCPTK